MGWGTDPVVSKGGWGNDPVATAESPSMTRARAAMSKGATSTGAQARLRSVAQGMTFGYSDELIGAGDAAGTYVRGLFGAHDGYSPAEAYHASVDDQRGQQTAFHTAHPVQDTAIQLGSGLITPGLGEASLYVKGGKTALGIAGRSAVVGGLYGAAAGSGNAQGGLYERAKGAAVGGTVGAAVGAVAPTVGQALLSGGRALNNLAGQPFNGAVRGAIGRLRTALEQDGLTPAAITAAVAKWHETGVTPEFLNVVGENTRALIRAAAGKEGPARVAAQGYRDKTVASIPTRAVEAANALTPGETRTPAAFSAATRKARKADATVRYGPTNGTLVDATPEMASAIRGESGRAAIAEARRAAAADRDHALMAELDQLPDGDLSSIPPLSARAWDAVRQEIRNQATRESTNNASKVAAGLGRRVDDIDTALDNVPGLADARSHYRSQSEAMRAAEGKTGMLQENAPHVMNPSSEFGPYVGELDPLATTGAKIRNRQMLRDSFGIRDNAMGLLKDVRDAPDIRDNITGLYGEDGRRFIGAAGNLFDKQSHANFIAPNTGSQTQLRDSEAKGLFSTASQLFEMAHGSMRPLIERMARGMTMTEAERAILVRMGIGAPEDAVLALSAPAPVARVAGRVGTRVGIAASPAAARSVTQANGR